jgi:hypothetical protein
MCRIDPPLPATLNERTTGVRRDLERAERERVQAERERDRLRREVDRLQRDHFGLAVTANTVTRALHRAARQAQPTHTADVFIDLIKDS